MDRLMLRGSLGPLLLPSFNAREILNPSGHDAMKALQ